MSYNVVGNQAVFYLACRHGHGGFPCSECYISSLVPEETNWQRKWGHVDLAAPAGVHQDSRHIL